MIRLSVFGEVPSLTDTEVTDLLDPFSVPADCDMRKTLSDRVEAAARHLVMFFSGPTLESVRHHEADYRDELGMLAADPARALGVSPMSSGAMDARDTTLLAATWRGVDADTRAGAAAIGNLAANLLAKHKPARKGSDIVMGEASLFEDLAACLRLVSPDALDALGSHEPTDARHPVASFAESFVQLVVDRTRLRLSAPSDGVLDKLHMLLNKSDRALLDGVRAARELHRKHADWMEEDGGR